MEKARLSPCCSAGRGNLRPEGVRGHLIKAIRGSKHCTQFLGMA